jgi:hypothetical protein
MSIGRDCVSELHLLRVIVHSRDYTSRGGMTFTGKNQVFRREACPSAILTTTNPTYIDQGANPGLRGDRVATNCLSHGTAEMPFPLCLVKYT